MSPQRHLKVGAQEVLSRSLVGPGACEVRSIESNTLSWKNIFVDIDSSPA
jgi:hypothetical protein